MLIQRRPRPHSFFFFNDTATTEIYTLSLHDALPISHGDDVIHLGFPLDAVRRGQVALVAYQILPIDQLQQRSEEHTSELQSQSNLVCRLLLEKKKSSELVSFSPNNSTAQ